MSRVPPDRRFLGPAAAETARQQAALAALRAELAAMGVAAGEQGRVLAQAMRDQQQETRAAAAALHAFAEEQTRAAAAAAVLAAANARAFAASLQGAIAGVTGALRSLTSTVEGYVRQGLAASVMGQLLHDQTARLAATVGGLFRPEIERVIDGVSRLTDWLQQLTAGQRELIAKVLLGAGAFATVMGVLPRLTAVLGPLIASVKALGVAITSGLAGTGIGALLPLLGLAAAALGAFLAGTETGRGIVAGLGEALQPLAAAFGELVQAAQPLFDALGKVARQLAGALAGALQAAIPLLSKLLEKAGPAFAQMGKVVDALAAAFGAIGEAVSAASEQFSSLFEEVGSYLQESIGFWTEFIGLIAEVVVAMKPLIAVFAQAFVNAIRVVIGALRTVAWVLTQIAGLLRSVLRTAGITTALPEPSERKEREREREKKKDKDRSPFELKVGGPEGIEATWARIARASARVGAGKPVDEQQLDVAKSQEALLRSIHVELGRLRPAVV